MSPASFDPWRLFSSASRARSSRRGEKLLFTHQTVKLSKGKHGSPEEGACVMELASMLAGESFTDHPESVCPVIGSFLRAYNDLIDQKRRQDLYAYASKAVGSRSSADVELARALRLAGWAFTRRARRRPRRASVPSPQSMPLPRRSLEAIAAHAARSVWRITDQTHAQALALIDELLAIEPGDGTGSAPEQMQPAALTEPSPQPIRARSRPVDR